MICDIDLAFALAEPLRMDPGVRMQNCVGEVSPALAENIAMAKLIDGSKLSGFGAAAIARWKLLHLGSIYRAAPGSAAESCLVGIMRDLRQQKPFSVVMPVSVAGMLSCGPDDDPTRMMFPAPPPEATVIDDGEHGAYGTDSESDLGGDEHSATHKPVDDRFASETILAVLELLPRLSLMAPLQRVCELVAKIMWAEPLRSDVIGRLQDGRINVPSVSTRIRSMRRLDVITRWWERLRWQHGYQPVSWLATDGSTQQSWNFLVTKTAEFPHVSAAVHSEQDSMQCVGQQARSRSMPLVCLGHSEADLPHNMMAMIHSAKLLTGSKAGFDQWRLSLRAAITDQGIERRLAECPYLESPADFHNAIRAMQHGDTDGGGPRIPASMPYAYLFPALVQVTGPQHIIWNAFEASIKHLDGWDSYGTCVALFAQGVLVTGHCLKGLPQSASSPMRKSSSVELGRTGWWTGSGAI